VDKKNINSNRHDSNDSRANVKYHFAITDICFTRNVL